MTNLQDLKEKLKETEKEIMKFKNSKPSQKDILTSFKNTKTQIQSTRKQLYEIFLLINPQKQQINRLERSKEQVLLLVRLHRI
jgi:hypothetical protein